jgi:hypothetical protein
MLAAGAACALQVQFTPTAAGSRTGTVTVVDNAAGSPQTVALTGVGVDFSLAANGATTATISAGQQAVYPLLLTSAAGVPGTVAFTCGPLPAHATCVVNPATPALGGTATITVTVATSVAGVAWRGGVRKMVWLAGLLPLGLVAARRRRWRAGMVLLGVMAMAGCGASRVIPATSGGSGTAPVPTPTGTYNLTVAGSSAGLTRSVGLTLVVQ